MLRRARHSAPPTWPSRARHDTNQRADHRRVAPRAARAGVPGTVIVTDVNPLSPAVHFGGRAYRVPLATDPSYIDELLAICQAERVGLVIPTIDDELTVFGASRQAFAEIGAVAACSPEETAAICNDKYATCHHLIKNG